MPSAHAPKRRLTLRISLLGLAAAWASAASANLLPSQVEWRYRPSVEEIASVYPKEAISAAVEGVASVECVVGDGGALRDCEVLKEAPVNFGFGRAAVELSKKARLQTQAKDGSSTVGQFVRMPVFFVLPKPLNRPIPQLTLEPGTPAFLLTPSASGDLACPTSAAPSRLCIRHVLTWELYPTAQQTWAAVSSGPTTGQDAMQCHVTPGRALSNCVALQPSSEAAELAMLRLSSAFRARPETPDKKATAGGTVALVFDWTEIFAAAKLSREGGRAK